MKFETEAHTDVILDCYAACCSYSLYSIISVSTSPELLSAMLKANQVFKLLNTVQYTKFLLIQILIKYQSHGLSRSTGTSIFQKQKSSSIQTYGFLVRFLE